MVVYQAMYGDFQIYVSTLSSFMEEIDRQKYPDADGYYRFELLGAQEVKQPVTQAPVIMSDTEEQETPRPEREEKETADIDAAIQEELNIDPLVMEFLEADTYEQRLNILAALRSRITDEMINTMAMAVDLEIKEGDVEERYEELRNCLLTFEKYECNRLR